MYISLPLSPSLSLSPSPSVNIHLVSICLERNNLCCIDVPVDFLPFYSQEAKYDPPAISTINHYCFNHEMEVGRSDGTGKSVEQ